MKGLMIKELIESKGNFISGQEMSRRYNISRAAVWKYIKKLKEEGYEIKSVNNKGYCLISEPDRLETAYLDFKKEWKIGRKYIYLEEVDSTNEYAKKIANNRPDGTIVLAEDQTKGKGRLGRSWCSGDKEGIWMSFILKPDIMTSDAMLVTQIAAASVVKGLNDALDCNAKIKWPNDIVLGNKKVCGILTELSGEIESLNYIILGIGINVNQDMETFSDELKKKATSLKHYLGKHVSRKEILLSVIENLNLHYNDFLKNHSLADTIDICRNYSATLSKEVKIIHNGEERQGKAIDLTDQGGLIIEDQEGKTFEIISGEVSVRGLYDYLD